MIPITNNEISKIHSNVNTPRRAPDFLPIRRKKLMSFIPWLDCLISVPRTNAPRRVSTNRANLEKIDKIGKMASQVVG